MKFLSIEFVVSVFLGLITCVYLFYFIKSIFQKKKNVNRNIDNINQPVFIDVSKSLIFDTSEIEYISTNNLIKDNKKFVKVIYQIQKGLDLAQNNPYVTNEIAEYLKRNMLQNNKHVVDYLFPIFNHLTESGNLIHSHFIGSFFSTLQNDKLIKEVDFIAALQESGSSSLIEAFVEYDIKSKGVLSKTNLNLILEVSYVKNKSVLLRKYADYLADAFKNSESDIVSLLESILPTITLSNVKDLKSKKNQHLLNFLTKFLVKVFVDSAGNFEKIDKVLKLIIKKYALIIDAVFDIGTINPVKKIAYAEIKKSIYKTLEESGINQWNQAIGNIYTGRDINNFFFVEHSGVNQRDLLYEFLPYLVDLYNKKHDNLEANHESKYYQLSLKMIQFAPYSVIGYISILGMVSLIAHSYPTDSKIIKKVSGDSNYSGL
jgi:hypothetical protein